MRPLYIYLSTFLSILAISCSKDHEIPIADLEYKEFRSPHKKHPRLDIYEVFFFSNIDLDSFFIKKGGSPRLYCSLENSNNFDIKEITQNNRNLSGSFYFLNQNKKQSGKFLFRSEVFFYDKDDEFLNKKRILKLLSNKSCIPCKVEERFYLNTYKPYLSNSMCIPVKDILKVINE
ncbi:hypothetical protein ATE84_4941 [Aquimarina sp. MAR_2010_214]|uniref:hypothetical protein n=1 Tax=Aquimarina sp. MAR_2010_214 TaxID=1250026 RepID=UPI000C707B51|nr:hypothetical protein [Aquimarina sp. MAR_2010_214]PKV52814.1 hypothetical protein ATE84_4941 [Aquimarina sp. MAR_2010_214]